MTRTATTLGVLCAMTLLAGADIVFIEGAPPLGTTTEWYGVRTDDPADADNDNTADSQEDTNAEDAIATDDTDTTDPTLDVEPPTPNKGVRKHTGPNVLGILEEKGFSTAEANEKTVLARVVEEEGIEVHSNILLLDDDRAALIAWISTPNVKVHYLTIKEVLHAAFTAELHDLIDETQHRENRPTRNFLSFMDPGLIKERVVFIRARERIYEFHIAEGHEDAIFDLIEELTK